MQKSPKVAALEVIVNVTHHHRGAGCSTTPEMRSVNQLKLRRCNTSGIRASGCCTAVDASASMISGAVGVWSIRKLQIADCRLQMGEDRQLLDRAIENRK